MTERQLEERLRRWHLAEAEASPPPPYLATLVDEVVDAGVARTRRPLARSQVIVWVALLLLLTAALGVVVLGSRILPPDRPLSLDPAALDPCEILPGPGFTTTARPKRHTAPAVVGGDACAYGWDDGGNLHLQLRDARTTRAEAERIAVSLFDLGDDYSPSNIVVDGHDAWLGRATWPPKSSGGEVLEPCAAMAVSAEPYFFVAWLTCRDGLPLPTEVDWEGFRERLVFVSRRVLTNLEAVNDGRPVPHRIEVDPGRGTGS
jgi:hypothetical protein